MRVYEPNNGRLTPQRVWKWVNQFPKQCRDDVARLAANLEIYSTDRIISNLESLNAQIAGRLEADGIPGTNIVYVSLDDPPSSSSLMCKLLRDQGGLSGARFVPATSGWKISELTEKLEKGAVVYVDDFSASGNQVEEARAYVQDHMPVTFSEFFLLPCICEEALRRVERQDIVAVYKHHHTRSERPLLPECDFLSDIARRRIVQHSESRWGVGSLGFKMMATNVVFQHASPDTTPIMFRGDMRQQPWFGIVPRWAEVKED